MIMEIKKTPSATTHQYTSEKNSPKIKVIVLPASQEVVVRQDDAELTRYFEIKHRPRKGFSYDGPGGHYQGL
jgi:hypothetical protein